jgi:hypothetical protein
LRRILLRLGGEANAYGLLLGFLFGGKEGDLLFPFRDRHFTGRLNLFLGLGGEGAGLVGLLSAFDCAFDFSAMEIGLS